MQQNTINCTHNKGDFRFLYICHVKKLKLIHLWKIFSFLHMFHVQKFEISPHDRFFLHGHRPCVRDKYEVYVWLWFENTHGCSQQCDTI